MTDDNGISNTVKYTLCCTVIISIENRYKINRSKLRNTMKHYRHIIKTTFEITIEIPQETVIKTQFNKLCTLPQSGVTEYILLENI